MGVDGVNYCVRRVCRSGVRMSYLEEVGGLCFIEDEVRFHFEEAVVRLRVDIVRGAGSGCKLTNCIGVGAVQEMANAYLTLAWSFPLLYKGGTAT
jgi:hypothetical protein